MEKLLQYIQTEAIVSMQSYLLTLSFIFHLIITHPTITEDKIEEHLLVQLLPTSKIIKRLRHVKQYENIVGVECTKKEVFIQ